MSAVPIRYFLWLGLALVVPICFGIGFASGRGMGGASPRVGETGSRAQSPRVPLSGASRDLDPEVRDVFLRMVGASHDDFVSELERRLDGDFSERPDAQMAFLIRWVMEDAEGAADYLIGFFENGEDDEAERYEELMGRFFMVWLKQDYAGLQGYTERLVAREHPLAEDFEELVGMGGSGSSPLEYLGKLKPEQYAAKQWEMGEALQNLASQDPQAALEFLESMPDGDHSVREQVLKKLAAGWARNDAAAALAWAGGLEQQGERLMAQDHVIAEMAAQDVTAAAEAFGKIGGLLGSGSGQGNSKAVERILFEFSKKDIGRALKWLHATAGDQFDNPRTLDPLIRFAPRDPTEFRALLDSIEPSMIQTNLAMKMPIDYRSGPGEFLSKLAEMPDDNLRRYMLSIGMSQWARQDPQGVKDSVLSLPESVLPRAAVRALVHGESFDSVAEGVEFARLTGADATREPFGGWMGARKDAADAAEFFSSLPPAVGGSTPPALSFLRGWARHSPDEALDWMEAQENDRAMLAGGLVSGWMHADPTAASEWAGTLEGGEVRDVVAGVIASATMYSDPAASFAWGLSISDEAKREQYLRTTLQQWHRSAPEAASQALLREDVPQSLRDAYLLK